MPVYQLKIALDVHIEADDDEVAQADAIDILADALNGLDRMEVLRANVQDVAEIQEES